MKNFKVRIKSSAKEFRGNPIYDGIVNEVLYNDVKPRILWVLKEANDEGNEAWDMRGALRNDIKTSMGFKKGWDKTFRKLTQVTNGLLRDSKFNQLERAQDKPDILDDLQRIAYINVKKTGGGSVAKDSELKKHYDYNRELLRDQIEAINPDVIIFGATFWLFKKDIEVKMHSFGSCDGGIWKEKNRIILWPYHPAYFGIKDETYFNDLTHAYNSLKEQLI